MSPEDVTEEKYSLGLMANREITGVEISMHILAQTTRFVHRKEMTCDEAAKLAIDMASAFVKAVNELPSGESE